MSSERFSSLEELNNNEKGAWDNVDNFEYDVWLIIQYKAHMWGKNLSMIKSEEKILLWVYLKNEKSVDIIG